MYTGNVYLFVLNKKNKMCTLVLWQLLFDGEKKTADWHIAKYPRAPRETISRIIILSAIF